MRYPLIIHSLCTVLKMAKVDWNKVEVLHSEKNQTKRMLLESLYIAKEKNATNRNEGMVHGTVFQFLLGDLHLPKPKGGVYVLDLP